MVCKLHPEEEAAPATNVSEAPKKCKDLFRMYTDAELAAYKQKAELKRRRNALRQVLADDYKRENCELNAIDLCYGRA